MKKVNSVFPAINAGVVYHEYLSEVYELSYLDIMEIHNLEHHTWVKQVGETSEESDSQWNESYWENVQAMPGKLDALIKDNTLAAAEK